MIELPPGFPKFTDEQSSYTPSWSDDGQEEASEISDIEEGMFHDTWEDEHDFNYLCTQSIHHHNSRDEVPTSITTSLHNVEEKKTTSCTSDSENDEDPSEKEEENDRVDSRSYLAVLRESMNGAGRWAFGIAAIEIWVLNEETGLLDRARGGWWRDRVFEDSVQLRRLEDINDIRYLEPESLVVGLSSAGVLYSEVQGNFGLAPWRDLTQLANDPDQPQNERLNCLAKAFGLATGMYFRNGATNGIVVFYARRSVNLPKISSDANLVYLRASADLLGSVVSWETPRETAIIERRKDFAISMARVRNRLLALYRMGLLRLVMERTSGDMVASTENTVKSSSERKSIINLNISHVFSLKKIKEGINGAFSYSKHKVIMIRRKMIGGGQIPPPGLSNEQCLFALVGSFFSLLTLSVLNGTIKETSGKYQILLSPLGALVTCHYGLTSAPASQPRNSLAGLVVASVIAVSFSYIPKSVLPEVILVPAAASIAITVTLALGIAHPPAGAVAVNFASMQDIPSHEKWMDFLLLLVGYFVAIFFATFFINFHEGRSFPMYWGIPDPVQVIWSSLKRKGMEKRSILQGEGMKMRSSLNRKGMEKPSSLKGKGMKKRTILKGKGM